MRKIKLVIIFSIFFLNCIFLISTGFTKNQSETSNKSPKTNSQIINLDSRQAAKKCLEPFPGSKQFCSGSVVSEHPKGFISWHTYYTKEDIEAVLKHYKKKCDSRNYEAVKGKHYWRFPPTNARDVLVLSPKKLQGPSDECKIPKGAKTIIEVSYSPQ